MKYMILPAPKELTEHEGHFCFNNCDIYLADGLDLRVVRAALKLKKYLEDKTGNFHKFSRLTNERENSICISKNTVLPKEGYRIEITEKSISIYGGGDAGCFYGIGTLIQIMDNSKNTISAMTVNDCPDMEYRGFYHDATRGRVPSVKGIKEMIDNIARFKMNSLQLYVEHSFNFDEFRSSIRTEDDYLTAEDILEIDRYCYDNFIDFIPSLSTFGHLYELLMKKEYTHLCELENYKPTSHFWLERMKHHTIDASNPQSFEVVSSLIDQYLPLFRSKYFNICCDETFDLCRGKNLGKESAELYIDFVSKIAAHVTGAGKTVMMWGDIVLNYPHLLSRIPEGTIILNYDYGKNPNISQIERVSLTGNRQIVCPGTSSWSSLIEYIDISVLNILQMVLAGKKAGAIGMLNTNWGDFGHPCNPECSLYGAVFGASVSWNVKTQADDDFNKSISKLVYESDTDIVPVIKELSTAQHSADWIQIYKWVETRDASCFTSDEETLYSASEKCKKIYDVLKESSGPLGFIAVAAKGIGLLNDAVLMIKKYGKTDVCWQRSASSWFSEYKKCWFASSKPSEINEIRNFIAKI